MNNRCKRPIQWPIQTQKQMSTWCEARENVCARITLCCGFFSDWLTKWRELFNNRPLSHGGHFVPQENKKLCFCTSSLALAERLAVQNLLFQHCVIKVYRTAQQCKPKRRQVTLDIQVETALNKHSQDRFSIGNQSSSVFVVDFTTGYGFNRRLSCRHC